MGTNPTFGLPTYWYIYQTLKGNIPPGKTIRLQLMDTRSEFATPYGVHSTHLIFLTRKRTADEPTEYRTIEFRGANILLSPFGHEKPPEGETVKEQITALLRGTLEYNQSQREKERAFLEQMIKGSAEPDAANRSQPIHAETNRTSAFAVGSEKFEVPGFSIRALSDSGGEEWWMQSTMPLTLSRYALTNETVTHPIAVTILHYANSQQAKRAFEMSWRGRPAAPAEMKATHWDAAHKWQKQSLRQVDICLLKGNYVVGVYDVPSDFSAEKTNGLLDALADNLAKAGAANGSQPTAAESSPDPFPIIPPIADADPSVRHPVPVRVPTAMFVVRDGDSLTVSFPTLEMTNLMVGHKMVTGIKREDSIYHDGITKPRGMSLQGALAFESGTNVLTLGRDGIPQAGQEFTLEQRITMFETDLPAQHMWSPQSGKHYRVLWTQTFREIVK